MREHPVKAEAENIFALGRLKVSFIVEALKEVASRGPWVNKAEEDAIEVLSIARCCIAR
jgi:hypothetical protein